MTPLLPNGRLYARAIALLTLIIVGAAIFRLPQAEAAATFTVNSLADTSDAALGNGTCADAGGACTLRAAIEEANTLAGNETINVSVNGTINLTGPLPSLTNITINGPGASLLTVRRDTGGNYRIFHINGFIVNISGLTVTNGRTPDGAADAVFGNAGGDGAGIFATGTVTLTDVVVTGNRTGNGGPGGSGTGGWGGSGGGISGGGTLTLLDVIVSNNSTGNGETGANGGSGGRGGGIFFTGTALTLLNCTVSGNTTGNGAVGTNVGASGGGGGDGAGILMNGGTLTMTNSIIAGNNSGDANFGGTGGVGGGLMTMPGINSTLVDVTVSNNTTGDGGGGFTGQGGRGGGIANHGTMIIRSSTISSNTTGTAGATGGDSGGIGGGIFNGAVLRIVNSTVSGNQTTGFNASGGGIHNNGSTLTVVNSTITGNAAITNMGNGIHQGFFAAPAVIQNSIVAQNVGGPDTSGTFSSQGHNLIGNADDSTGFTTSDLKGTTASPLNAMLGSLTNNGGPTQTHALLAGSPALDAGDNALAVDTDSALVSDQRGTGRIADSADAGTTATVDIGAYEFHQTLDAIADRTINEDSILTLSFAVGDSGPPVTSVTASSTHQGLLPDANLSVTGTGPVRSLQALPLANLSGATTITVTSHVSGGAPVNSSFQLTVVAVNDAPSFSKGADQTVNEDAGPRTINNWATAISAGPNEAGQTLTFTVTNDNPGLFSVAPAISSSGALTYTPAANAFGVANLTVTLNDNGGAANGGQDTSASQTFKITVQPVNDAPSFTKGANPTVNEDPSPGFPVTVNWATNISPGPGEGSQSVSFLVTNNTNPSLFFTQPTVGSDGRVTFRTAFNANGTADITVVAKDNGGTANGGVDTSAPETFTITVLPVNDAPTHRIPGFSQPDNVTARNTPLVLGVNVADVDAGNDPIRVSFSTTDGTLTLASKTGLTFTTGDGTDDTAMAFSGTVTAINAGVFGMTFKPNKDFVGDALVQFVSNDDGHNGAGGAKTTSTPFQVLVQEGGRFSFNTALYGVNESAGTATITVLREDAGFPFVVAGTASVSYATSNGSATSGVSCSSGVDYLPASGTFTWGPGDSSPRQFTITICNDALTEGEETINLTLSNAGGSGVLGNQPDAVLTVGTDDGPMLLMDNANQEAIALDLVTLTRDPFSLTNPFNMSTDRRRRISLFIWQTEPLTSADLVSVMATVRDQEFRSYPMEVEALIPVMGVPGVTQVVVRLPDSIIGAPRPMLVKLTVKTLTTNEAFIFISGP